MPNSLHKTETIALVAKAHAQYKGDDHRRHGVTDHRGRGDRKAGEKLFDGVRVVRHYLRSRTARDSCNCWLMKQGARNLTADCGLCYRENRTSRPIDFDWRSPPCSRAKDAAQAAETKTRGARLRRPRSTTATSWPSRRASRPSTIATADGDAYLLKLTIDGKP